MENEPVEKAEETPELDLAYKDKKEIAKGGVLGFFIGLAIIVPGVSGSTVAIIFRLYEKLLYAIGNIFNRFKKCIRFLIPILFGLVIGVVLGFLGVQHLLEILPFATVALFAGLMAGSYPSVTDQVKGTKKKPLYICLFVLGIAIPVAIALITAFLVPGAGSLENLSWWHYPVFLILGAVISVTQIVPGLSASALLMAFGYFTPLMESVSLEYWRQNPLVFAVYACLAVGFILGLVGFSKLLSMALKKWHDAMFFLVSGLSLGSIISMFCNSETIDVYKSWGDGIEWLDLGLGIALFIVGLVAAYLFVMYERKHPEEPEKEKPAS